MFILFLIKTFKAVDADFAKFVSIFRKKRVFRNTHLKAAQMSITQVK